MYPRLPSVIPTNPCWSSAMAALSWWTLASMRALGGLGACKSGEITVLSACFCTMGQLLLCSNGSCLAKAPSPTGTSCHKSGLCRNIADWCSVGRPSSRKQVYCTIWGADGSGGTIVPTTPRGSHGCEVVSSILPCGHILDTMWFQCPQVTPDSNGIQSRFSCLNFFR